MRWPELHRRCLAAALALSLPAGCSERERWPRSERVRAVQKKRTPECQAHELCVSSAGECPSELVIPRDQARDGTPQTARFDAHRTEQRRGRFPYDAGPMQTCCYSWTEGCRGRPLFDGRGRALSRDVPRHDWLVPLDVTIDPRAREHWRAAAAHEHASIASFARTALELVELGAPLALIAAHHRAACDEIRHARVAYTLASSPDAPVGPGPLRVALATGRSHAELAIEVFLSGCVAETLAAAVAHECAKGARPELAAILARIAEDELAHAELAWRTVAWLLGRAGTLHELVRRTIAGVAQDLAVRAGSPRPRRAPRRSADIRRLAAAGVLSDAATRQVESRARREIVLPCARALLAAS